MNQIFIGMAGMKVLPKSHANHFVEVLRAAGIRLVYFSNKDRRTIFCRQSDLTFSLLEAPAVPHCLNQPFSKSDPLPLLTSRNFETPISNTCTIEIPKYPTVLPCSLVFHGRTHFNEILKFFHVGRQLLTNTRQRSLFILSASMSLVLMTLKIKIWSNIFSANLYEWSSNVVGGGGGGGSGGGGGGGGDGVSFSSVLLEISQNNMMFAFVYYLCVTSISFIQSIAKFNPLRNYVWVSL
ncbi:hypothetical protein ACTFIY_005204 [Dictyostelium cf. discoideum]